MERGKHLKYYPYAFTEGGIAMLSGVRTGRARACRRGKSSDAGSALFAMMKMELEPSVILGLLP